jgi:hypothetical protein
MIGRWSAVLAMALLAPLARAADASLDVVAQTPAGGKLAVRWSGPGGATDFISIDPVGAPDGNYGPYAYPARSNPVAIDVPDQPGDYVVRYHRGSSGYPVIATAPLRVTDGGGSYSAQNGTELQQAIRAALNPAFEVLAGSDVVATGAVNGDPVALPPGQYTVRLRDAAARDVGTVTIASGGSQELNVD